MKIQRYDILGPVLVTPRVFRDDRGFFVETYNHAAFCEALGEDIVFVQDNHSLSVKTNTLRGLHYQSAPHVQGKLVRCGRGSILDVAVDARSNSNTYGQHVKAILSAENGSQLWVPPGFLHAFLTLEPDSEVLYKVTDYYSAECYGNVSWNDSDLNIDWGVSPKDVFLSEKDKIAPAFSQFVPNMI